LLIFILSWYGVVDIFEITEESLEFILLEKVDLFLIMSQLMFMSILDGKLAICKDLELRAEVEKYIFANSLVGTTIQDDSKREKSDDAYLINCQPILEL